MTRLPSIQNLGYYPAPEEFTDAVAKLFQPAPQGATAFDGCAGKGEALERFCAPLGLLGYANELDNTRFKEVEKRFPGRALIGDMFTISASKGFASIAWLNPPYSLDATATKRADKRRELSYVRHIFKRAWIVPEGYLVLVLYEQHLTSELLSHVARHCSTVDIYQWPELVMDTYHHVAVIGKLGKGANAKALIDQVTGQAWCEWGEGLYSIPLPAVQTPTFHQIFISNEEIVAAAQSEGPHLDSAFQLWNAEQEDLRHIKPVQMMKLGHLLTCVQSGMLNGVVISNGRTGVIASTLSYTQTETFTGDEDEDEDSGKRKVKTTKVMKAVITITYDDNDIVVLDTDDKVKDFIITYADQLFAALQQRMAPAFDIAGDEQTYYPKAKWLPAIRECKVEGKHDLFPAQEAATNAMLHLLYGERRKGGYVVASPSFGKTSVGLSLIHAAHARGEIKTGEVAMVVCPAHLIDKWEREAKTMLPGVRVLKLSLTDRDGDKVDILREFADFVRSADAGINLIIASQDSIKLGDGWRQSFHQNKYLLDEDKNSKLVPTLECPNTGIVFDADEIKPKAKYFAEGRMFTGHLNPVEKVDGQWQIVKLDQDDSPADNEFKVPGDHVVFDQRTRTWKTYRDIPRHFAQWQEVRKTRLPRKGNGKAVYNDKGDVIELLTAEVFLDPWLRDKGVRCQMNPRLPLWRLVKAAYKNRIAILILDEVHESGAITTDIFESALKLAQSSRKVIAMTGTLSRGFASSIFGLEWIVNPTEMAKFYPWGDVGRAQWIHDMGVLVSFSEEQVEKAEVGEQTGKIRKKLGSATEQPGASPRLVAWLLDHAIFYDLSDLGKQLPPYQEVPKELSMTRAHLAFYNKVWDLCDHKFVSDLLRFGYLSRAINTPHQDIEVWGWEYIRDDDDNIIQKNHVYIGTAKAISPLEVTTKEQDLIDTINNSLAQGRGVGVYVQQVKKRDYRERLKTLIESSVPNAHVIILDADKVKPINREKWISDQCAKGANVLITNPRLVQTGLDLLGFPVLYWFEFTLKLTEHIQASGRARRIPQKMNCETVLPFYGDTVEESHMSVLALKVHAHAILNGSEVGLTDPEDNGSILDDILAQGKGGQFVDIQEYFKDINRMWAGTTRIAPPVLPVPDLTPAPEIALVPEVKPAVPEPVVLTVKRSRKLMPETLLSQYAHKPGTVWLHWFMGTVEFFIYKVIERSGINYVQALVTHGGQVHTVTISALQVKHWMLNGFVIERDEEFEPQPWSAMLQQLGARQVQVLHDLNALVKDA